MNQLLDSIESETAGFNPDTFTCLNDLWRKLIGYNNYYRLLWAAVAVLQPRNVVEIGRERGVSTVIMLDTLPKESQLQSVDICECMLEHGEPCFVHDNVDPRLILITGNSVDPNVVDLIEGDIDFLFIDGDHTGDHVAKEWALYRPKMSKKSVIALDDIHFNEGMTEFWNSIKEEKYDISHWHEPGFGVVFIND